MLNLKIGGIVAGAAFILSLILGFVGGTAMPQLIIRPIIFAVIFFVISGFIKIIVSRFLPEILEDDGGKEGAVNFPGSHINIMEGDLPGGAKIALNHVSFGAIADESEEGLGDISELLTKKTGSRASSERTQAGMDQNPQEDYTGDGVLGKFSKSAPDGTPEHVTSPAGKPAGGTDFEGISGEDTLPDLDSMSGAFMSSVSGGESDTADPSSPVSRPSSGSRSSSRKKAPEWSGDFNAKDLASGLRTILSKEKEG